MSLAFSNISRYRSSLSRSDCVARRTLRFRAAIQAQERTAAAERMRSTFRRSGEIAGGGREKSCPVHRTNTSERSASVSESSPFWTMERRSGSSLRTPKCWGKVAMRRGTIRRLVRLSSRTTWAPTGNTSSIASSCPVASMMSPVAVSSITTGWIFGCTADNHVLIP